MKRFPFAVIAILIICIAQATAALPDSVNCSNDALNVTFQMRTRTLRVTNRPAGRRWIQKPNSTALEPSAARERPNGFDITFIARPGNLPVQMHLTLDGDGPEFEIVLDATGPMPEQVMFPAPFLNEDDNDLILPFNEGLALNVEDPLIVNGQFPLNTGHGLNMPFFGATDGRDGCMAIIETPDDATVEISHTGRRAVAAPIWIPQKGQWGQPRKIRYVFTRDGGYVSMAKRYRAYAAAAGKLRTLQEKRAERPDIDLLVGAANVWYWRPTGGLEVLREMQRAGISRMLWSKALPETDVAEMNSLGVLTGRYEIYRALLDPALIPDATYPKPDWPVEGWPAALRRDSSGNTIEGFIVRLRGGAAASTRRTCDLAILPYAAAEMEAELQHIPFRARFLDVTGALPLDECYDPSHPMTRTDSRISRQKLIGLISSRYRLIAGTEDGADCYVPSCDYFEGNMSILNYRSIVPPETLGEEVDPPPANIVNQQLNEQIRIPLWELVYHDCVISYWHWDDTNNKYPAAWHRRDLFNALYGTPPMYGITPEIWKKRAEQFVKSFSDAATVARETGYSEMTDHRYLTRNRRVQQTRFANGIAVTVNFGDKPYEMDDDYNLAAGAWRLQRNIAK